MIRAVLDTVVFVRALINPKGMWGRLLFSPPATFVVVTSPDIIAEVLEVIYRPSLASKLRGMADPPTVERVIALLATASIVQPDVTESICRDPSDDKFFAAARKGAAEYIVSEDLDVLDIPEYHGTRTIAARAFLDILAAR